MSLISLDCSQCTSGGCGRNGHGGDWKGLYNFQVRHSLLISFGTFWILKLLAKKNISVNLKERHGGGMLKSLLLWNFRRNSSLKCHFKPSRMAAVGEGDWGQWSEFNLCDPKSCPPALACAAQPVPSTTWPWSSTLAALWIPFLTPDSSYILYVKYNIIKMPFRRPFVKV